MTALAALSRSPRARVALALAALPAAALLAISPGGVSGIAARGALVAAAVGLAAAWIRRRERPAVAPPLSVAARAALSGDAGLAVVEAGGRRLLVGWGRGGVAVVAELDAPPPEAGP